MCECGLHTEETDAPSSFVRTSPARLSELWMECRGDRYWGEAIVGFVLWGVGAVILQCNVHFYETSNNLEVVFVYIFNG